MAGTTVSAVPALIPTLYEPGIRDSFFSSTEIFKQWAPTKAVDGGYDRWPMGTDGTDYARATTEGGTLPNSNVDSAIKLEIALTAFEVVAEMTHEAQADARRDGIDPWLWSISRATKYLIAKVNSTLLTTFEAAIAAASTYGGQTRTSYTSALVSGAEATSASLTYDYLATALRTCLDSTNNEYRDLALYLSPTGLFRYAKVANLSTPVARTVTRSADQRTDAGLVYTINGEPPSFEGIPIRVINGMTSTTYIIGPGLKPGEVKVAEGMNPDGSYGPKLYPLAKDGRTDKALIDCRYQVRVTQPALWYKLTNKS